MTNILNIFETYGWAGIIVIVLIGIIYLLIKSFKQQVHTDLNVGIDKIADKITDSMSKQNETLVSTINQQNEKMLEYIVSRRSEEEKDHTVMVEERMSLSNEINQKLRDILNINNAHRVLIIEFHNSFKNMSGVPFAKYSCTYEWLAIGASSIALHAKNESFSTSAAVVDDIIKNDGWQKVYNDIEELQDVSPTLYSLWNDNNAKSLIYNAMYDQSNMMIGMLIVEFKGAIPPHVKMEELKFDAAQISSIINLRYKYNAD